MICPVCYNAKKHRDGCEGAELEKQASLAALREVREMVAVDAMREDNPKMAIQLNSYATKIQDMIAREEGR